MTKTKNNYEKKRVSNLGSIKENYFSSIQYKKIKLLAQEIKKLNEVEFKSFMLNFGDSSMTELYLKIQTYCSKNIK